MCLEKTARYLLGKITNRDAKNVWKLIQRTGYLIEIKIQSVAVCPYRHLLHKIAVESWVRYNRRLKLCRMALLSYIEIQFRTLDGN